MLYLPGIDGTGLAASRQFPFLVRAFDLKALSVPGDDRTPFSELVTCVGCEPVPMFLTCQDRELVLPEVISIMCLKIAALSKVCISRVLLMRRTGGMAGCDSIMCAGISLRKRLGSTHQNGPYTCWVSHLGASWHWPWQRLARTLWTVLCSSTLPHHSSAACGRALAHCCHACRLYAPEPRAYYVRQRIKCFLLLGCLPSWVVKMTSKSWQTTFLALFTNDKSPSKVDVLCRTFHVNP